MLTIGSEQFNIENVYDRTVTIPDSFVVMSNKIGKGHGEAKLYIGDKEEVQDFFEFTNTSTSVTAFMLKTDLLNYLDIIRKEYDNPSQSYTSANEFPALWKKRYQKVLSLKEEVLLFNVSYQYQIVGPRGYINSSDDLYTLIRELSLPLVTFLSVMKLKDSLGSVLYYLKLFVDFDAMKRIPVLKTVFNYGRKKGSSGKTEPEKQVVERVLTDERVGQARYRQKLLEECPYCPITKIVFDELLIASHIKPYAVCDEEERYDSKNGFILSPLYDKLFDRGLLTFGDMKEALYSPWLRKPDLNRFELKPNQVVVALPLDDDRKKYLEFHRKNVFRTVGTGL